MRVRGGDYIRILPSGPKPIQCLVEFCTDWCVIKKTGSPQFSTSVMHGVVVVVQPIKISHLLQHNGPNDHPNGNSERER